MKKTITIIVILFYLLATGCSSASEVSNVNDSNGTLENYHAETIPVKTIVVENFIQAILLNGVLVPGEGSEWGLDKDTFIKNVYGSELVDSASGYHQEQRTSTNKSGISTIEPPLDIQFKNIDTDYSSIPIYVFDENESLYGINYRYMIDISEEDKLLNITKGFISEISSQNKELILEEGDVFDVNSFNFKEDKLVLKWATPEEKQFVRIVGVNFQERFILDVFVSNKPLSGE